MMRMFILDIYIYPNEIIKSEHLHLFSFRIILSKENCIFSSESPLRKRNASSLQNHLFSSESSLHDHLFEREMHFLFRIISSESSLQNHLFEREMHFLFRIISSESSLRKRNAFSLQNHLFERETHLPNVHLEQSFNETYSSD